MYKPGRHQIDTDVLFGSFGANAMQDAADAEFEMLYVVLMSLGNLLQRR
jgi:hypothetical protein